VEKNSSVFSLRLKVLKTVSELSLYRDLLPDVSSSGE